MLPMLVAPCLAGQATFVDVAEQAGLSDVFYCGRDDRKDYILEAIGPGVALLDYDRDGFLDAFFVSGTTLEGFPPSEAPSNHLYRNNGDGTFTKATETTGVGRTGWGHGACVGDIDNNGFDDLLVTYFGQNALYRNTGLGSFTDITTEADVGRAAKWSVGCAFLDYDLDGHLDLFVANYVAFDIDRVPRRGVSPTCQWMGQAVACGPRGLPGETDQLFRNLGGGRFEDVSEKAGIASVGDRYSLSVTPLDYNLDGWPDIYVAVDSQASILLENRRDGTFEESALFAGVALDENGDVQAGMGSAAADLDGDGRLDIFKTNFIQEASNVYMSSASSTFEDRVHTLGAGVSARYMGWGVGALDYDLDSWPDIIVANGHTYPEIEGLVPDNPYRQQRLLYRNVAGRRLEPVNPPADSAILAAHSSRGLAVGDYDNDGDPDVFVNNMNERPSLLRNDSPAAGSFLTLRLVGTQSNRSAIGARVSVRAGNRVLVQEVRSGSSFLSNHDLRLHFGLGGSTKADVVTIDWPLESSKDTISDVASGQFLEITEGSGITARSQPSHAKRGPD